MDVLDPDKLVLLIAFVIPGFVSLKTYEALGLGTPREASQQVIDAVAYSCLNYAILSFAIISIESSGYRISSPWTYGAFWFVFLFVVPVALACAYWKLRHSSFLQRTLPHPVGKPWDFVFSQRRPFWVVVKLKDGSQIAGRYDSDSFASSSPQPEQIYLEEAWQLNADGGFERQRTSTAGIIVLGTEIAAIELFRLTKGEGDERQEATTRGLPANREEGLPARISSSVDTETGARPPSGNRSESSGPSSEEALKSKPPTKRRS